MTTSRFPRHTPETAQGVAAERLHDMVERTGRVGPMVATMAGSPSVLAGYLDFSRAMKRSRLDRSVSERISLAVQSVLGCALCLAAHTQAARSLGVADYEIELATQGTSSDPSVAAIIDFALRVQLEPASITGGDIEDLRSHGFDDRSILDVVGLVALNALTGSFNLVAGLEPALDLATTA